MGTTLTETDIIQTLRLEPLPVEGGYFRPTYRGRLQLPTDVLPPGFTAERSITSAIFYFLTKDTKSRLHRLPTDELWHFYLGDAVALHVFHGNDYTHSILGHDLLQGQLVQVVVPAHSWFGAHLQTDGQWALMGCTLAPEYADEDFSLPGPADFTALLNQFPTQQKVLHGLR